MNWQFENTGEGSGRFNMERDNSLLASAKGESATLRLYRWSPYCLSLGAHQPEDTVNRGALVRDGIDVVKRATGGRAVLHAEELTYAVVIPLSRDFSPLRVYREVNEALLLGLSLYDTRLSEAEFETAQPDFAKVYQAGDGMACFSSAAKNELKFGNKKLIGSAQKKLGEVALQHGSILCGTFHRNIIHYLMVDEEKRSFMQKELDERTIELQTILGTPTDYDKLAECIRHGFEQHFSTCCTRILTDSIHTELKKEL